MVDQLAAMGAYLEPPPCGLALADGRAAETLVAAADHAARHWQSTEQGPLLPGTPAHKRACAAMFRETFNPYKPTIIDWPKLDPEARDRLVALPIWDIAVQTEGKASLRMQSFADCVPDPEWRSALSQNAWEEKRHKVVLSDLVAAYGIVLEPEPAYRVPRDTEWAYLVTGFSECIDSFFAFGLFAMAQKSGFFPAELVETFEPVMQEECRHILLFANWLAAHRKKLNVVQRAIFEVRCWGVWIFLAWERMGIARGMDGDRQSMNAQNANFTVTGAKAVSDVDVKPRELMQLCLSENERRFTGYDARLLRPVTMPWLTRLAVRAMRKWKALLFL